MSAVEAGSREVNNRPSARRSPVVMPSPDPADWPADRTEDRPDDGR